MNLRARSFENKKFLNFIRQLPCAITGRAGDNIHPHHVAQRSGVRNDYYCLPLLYSEHTRNTGHITKAQLANDMKENIEERIIFTLCMYIEMLEGKYDLDMDVSFNYLDYRKKLQGLFNGS